MTHCCQTKKKVAFAFLCEIYNSQYVEKTLQTLIGIDCELQDKYSILNIQELLSSNFINQVPLEKVTSCFRVLIKFGQNLLQPESSRPKHWRQVMLSGDNFVQPWADVKGAAEILQCYGYSVERNWGLEFPEGEQPNPEHVSLLSTELQLIILELELFHVHKHPFSIQIVNLLKSAQSLNVQAQFSYIFALPCPSSASSLGERSILPRDHLSRFSSVFSNSDVSHLSNATLSSTQGQEPVKMCLAFENSTVQTKLLQPQSKPEFCTNLQLQIPHSKKTEDSHQRTSNPQEENHSEIKVTHAVPDFLGPYEVCSEPFRLPFISPSSDEENQNHSPILGDVVCTFANHGNNVVASRCNNDLITSLPSSCATEEEKLVDFSNEVAAKDAKKHLIPVDDVLETFQVARDPTSAREELELCVPATEDLNEIQDIEMVLRRTASDRDSRVRDGSHCDLCGCSAPAVRCEKCSHQIFCLSCDDMYHRHPKRRSHVRKAVDPPLVLPPKPVSKPADPPRIPVPPPRRRKSQKSVPSSPVFGRRGSESQNPPLPKKEFSFMDKVGSLRRFMIGRPLPPVPKDEAPERPPKNSVWEQPQDKLEQLPTYNVNSLIHLRKQSAGSFSNASNESGSMQRPSPVVSDNEANSVSRNNFPNNRTRMHSPGYDNVPTPAERNWDDMQPAPVAPSNQWNQVDPNVAFQPQQTSYPSSLNKSDVDSGIHSFQGFPTLPKRGMYPNQYLDRNATLTRMNAPIHSASICDIPNRPVPQHPQMAMQQPLPQTQSVQNLNFMPHPHMGQGDTGQFMEQCGPCQSVPWMGMGMHHPPPCCHMDSQSQYQPEMLKRTPSQTSINFPNNGSEAGYRLNSYTSMGHLVNPAGMVPPHYQHPHHHGHHAHNHRPPSPTLSTHSSRLRNSQSVAADLSNASYYRGGRRSGYHGGGGRRSAMDVTSSEDDYFSAGASDEDDYRSVRSAGRNAEHHKSHPPNRQWQCEHCTFVNPPGSRICSVCCKTSAHPKVASDRRRRRREAGGAKSPSSGESLPPMAPRQSRNGKESVLINQDRNLQDEGHVSEQPTGDGDVDLHNYVETGLKISSSSPGNSPEVAKSTDHKLQEQNNSTEMFQAFNHNSEVGREEKLPAGMSSTKPENIMQVNGDNSSSSATNNVEEAEPLKKVASTSTSPPPQETSTQTASNEDPLLDDNRSMFRSTSRGSLTGTERDYSLIRRASSAHIGPTGDLWGPAPYSHRSVSRSSLFGPQSRDESPLRSLRGDADYSGYRDRQYPYDPPSRADFYLNLEDLIERRRQDTMRTQGFELVRLLRDAEQHNFTADDLQVALSHCGTQNPIQWLNDNWKNMIDTVVTLVTNYGRDKNENDIGVVSSHEAKECLRAHKGNIWAAVTECVEVRQRKFREMQARGDFSQEEITSVLTANQGNLEAAFLELSKNMVKPFTMKIWGPPVGIENEAGSTLPLAKAPSVISQIKSPATSPRTKSPTQSVVTGKLTLPLAVAPEDVAVITTPIATTTTTVSVLTSSVSTTTANPQPAPTTATVSTSRASIASSRDTSSEDGSKNPAAWQKVMSGGGSAVGGTVVQPSESGSSASASFKPANTSRRLSRTGSFSGGSFQSEDDLQNNHNSSNVKNNSSVQAPPKNDTDDLYVTVQWVSGKKPDDLITPPINAKPVSLPPKKAKMPPPPPPLGLNIAETANGDAVYASVQLLSTPEVKREDLKLEKADTNVIVGKKDSSIYSTVEFISAPGSKEQNNQPGKNNASTSSTLNKNVINANLTNVIRSSDFNDAIYAPLEFIRAQGVSRSRCNSPSRSRCSSPAPQIIRPASPIITPVINRNVDHVSAFKKPCPRPLSPVLPLKIDSPLITESIENASPVLNRKFEFHLSPLVTGHGEVKPSSTLNRKADSAVSRQQFVPSPVPHHTDPLVGDYCHSPTLLRKEFTPSPMTTLNRGGSTSSLADQKIMPVEPSPTVGSPAINRKSRQASPNLGDSEQDLNHETLNAALQTLIQDDESIPNAVAPIETDSELLDQNSDNAAGGRPPTPPLRTESSKLSPQFEFERRARMLLAEGKVPSYEKAELAVKLIDLNFDENDALAAAFDCSELYMAISYLQQDCELCAGKFCMRQMISMLNCTHCCCVGCAQAYFSIQIRDRNIMEAVCPFCNEPDLTDDEIAQDYFNNLDIVLKSLVEPEVHELFQRKLRDRVLMKDPNFHWCSQCSSGFISHPYAKRLMCPDCQVITCAQCRKPWEPQHDGISCEKFAEWEEANNPEFQAMGLEKHLAENGIDCPNCRFRYSLAKGGCMHFKCLQCKFDFCSGCGKPFKMGSKCTFSQHCVKLGLHAHHPRNCLFYLRDKEPADLQKLLTEHSIPFDTEPLPGSTTAMTESSLRKCQVMEQKEVPGGIMKDEICGNEVPEEHAGLCRLHYLEYLGGLIMKHHIDPLVVYSEDDLEACFRRWGLRLPAKVRKAGPDAYRQQMIKTIQEQIPLDEADAR